ncbi:unnamed protein product [Durusdinium trenchii]|uniref:Origin recognition complex subunit 6 n=1 Tax=Durusdinium trenchii TaxID=1381693 RepID=A0ABP0MLU3_9DINO
MPTVKLGEVLRQLCAADKFLGNVKSLPSFASIEETQFQKLSSMLQAATFHEEQCTKAAEHVHGLRHFSPKKVNMLLASVAAACGQSGSKEKASKGMCGPSCEAQDYSSLYRFLPDSVWKRLEGQLAHRLHVLCAFAAKLGLFCPTEKTVGVFTVILFWKEWRQRSEVNTLDKYKTYNSCRGQIRSVLKEYNCVATKDLRLQQLPPVFSELSSTHMKLYEHETPAAPSPELEEAIRTMKLRSSATGVSSNPGKQDFMNWLNNLRDPSGSSSSQMSGQELLPIEDGKMDSQSIGSGADPIPLLSASIALCKLKQEEKESVKVKKSVAKTLLELKNACADSQKKGKGPSQKRKRTPPVDKQTTKSKKAKVKTEIASQTKNKSGPKKKQTKRREEA